MDMDTKDILFIYPTDKAWCPNEIASPLQYLHKVVQFEIYSFKPFLKITYYSPRLQYY